MRSRTLTILLAAGLLFVAALAAWCDDSQLTVVQDESSMEQIIERYLKNTHQLVVNEKISASDKDDMYLELPFKAGPMPAFRVAVDSQPLNRDKDTNRVIERGVLINLYTGVHIKNDDLVKAQTAINDFNRRKAFSSVYIDRDGEVICCWISNVLSQGLPTEYVYDAVVHVQNLWNALYPELKAAGIAVETPAPPASD